MKQSSSQSSLLRDTENPLIRNTTKSKFSPRMRYQPQFPNTIQLNTPRTQRSIPQVPSQQKLIASIYEPSDAEEIIIHEESKKQQEYELLLFINHFKDREDAKGSQDAFNAGVQQELLNIFENRDLDLIKPLHMDIEVVCLAIRSIGCILECTLNAIGDTDLNPTLYNSLINKLNHEAFFLYSRRLKINKQKIQCQSALAECVSSIRYLKKLELKQLII
ncbi:MAG: hypothetical protein EZS28_042629 [Streblomastix strix]|uniref:Uncharacterized protein n=1 Tax=Streblomastix strix TaxID=222440 RepID=A0A5J4TUA5_9EUKA|nr:MAG: hypothetical protein EZS28_042629 [Streblomastix strix]